MVKDLTAGLFIFNSIPFIIPSKSIIWSNDMDELVNIKGGPEIDVMPSFDFSLRDQEQNIRLAEHKMWLNSIKRERPLPKQNFKVAVYIRYFNQTKYEDYIEFHKQQYLSTLDLCPNWEFVNFYIDEGGTAPNMENAKAWSCLLQDCFEEKVDLIITQKTSNISKNAMELIFSARLLASLEKPVGIYFVSEDMYTLATYYQNDLKDTYFLPGTVGQLE